MPGVQIYDHDLDIRQDPYIHMMRMVFGRWKPFILHAFTFDQSNHSDPTYFSHILKQLPISPKVLAENLKELEADGLISRSVLPESPPRAVYSLTEDGQALIPLLDMVYNIGWNDMKKKGLPIDRLGEMWHGYAERDEALMNHPYKPSQKPPDA